MCFQTFARFLLQQGKHIACFREHDWRTGALSVGRDYRFPPLTAPLFCVRRIYPGQPGPCLSQRSLSPVLHAQRALQPSQIQADGLQSAYLYILCRGHKLLGKDVGPQELPKQVWSATATPVKAFCGRVEPACPRTLKTFLGCNDVNKFYFFYPVNDGESPICQLMELKTNFQNQVLGLYCLRIKCPFLFSFLNATEFPTLTTAPTCSN